jgi:hypothetical protein
MKAYIAAPIFNDHQRNVVDQIKEILESRGLEVFSPYHVSQEIFKGRKPADCPPEDRRKVLQGNILGIVDCRLMVAWVGGNSSGHDQSGKPSSIDTGVVWEMGYAARMSSTPAAFGLPPDDEGLVTLAYIHDDDERQSMNLMLAGTVDGVAKGMQDLRMAVAQFVALGGKALQEAGWHPDKVLAADKEPLV